MIKLGYDELYDLTPRSFQNKLIGFKDYNEQVSQNDWEQTRLIVHSGIAPYSKQRLKPKDVLPFPWDHKYKVKKDIASKEHIQKVLEKYKKFEPKNLDKYNGRS